ncbi:MAG TPA: kelch repeat-containing protein [Planctomycetota bacterium]|nr:kelch repeat-containing protein [Planctomycetota bacterium]
MRGFSPAAILFATALATTAAAQDLRLRDGPWCAPGSMATDTSRGRIVALGTAGDTHEWDGQRWLHRPANGPALSRLSTVYDPVARRTLALSAYLVAETWDYDGALWRQRHPAATPLGAYYFPALTFDAGRGRPLLFGGSSPGQPLAETWEWTGTGWLQLHPPVSPPPRDRAAMAFDSGRGRAVLFGGGGPAGALDDTWEWDGLTWQQRLLTVRPGARYGQAMAFDGGRQRIVLFGGQSTTALGDLWEYDGTAWQQIIATGPAPAARRFAHLLPEPGSSELLLLGGADDGRDLRDGFRWNGVRWQPHAGMPVMPHWRASMGTAYEPGTGGALMFGSEVGSLGTLSGETWRWNGTAWALASATGPSARSRTTMWTDFAGVYLFGGSQTNVPSFLGDTWRWNGNTWTQVTTAVAPPPRRFAAVTYDIARGRAVLFGGGDNSGALDDTWTFDGTNWRQENPASSPPGRLWHGLAGDLLRGRVVLFGGADTRSNTPWFDDTWEWDGVTWIPIFPVARPAAAGGVAMDFDLRLGRVVLVQPDATRPGLAVFGYDGATWTPIPLASNFPFTLDHDVVYRFASQRLEVFTGSQVIEVSRAPALAEVVGNGCGADVPTLAARSWPRVGATDFGLEMSRTPAGAACAIVGGTTRASLPIGPCTLLVSPVLASVFVLANADGFAPLAVPIPGNTALLGATPLFQAAALDATAPAGFTMTAGLRVMVGD